jgi:hypothetical protein
MPARGLGGVTAAATPKLTLKSSGVKSALLRFPRSFVSDTTRLIESGA